MMLVLIYHQYIWDEVCVQMLSPIKKNLNFLLSYIQYEILVLGMQHSDLMFLYIMK